MNISNGNSFLHAMGDGAASAVIGFIRFTDAAERVLWQAGEVSSCALRSVVCVQGFEKLAKANLANTALLSVIPCMSGIFSEFSKTMEAQKDLCYATGVFSLLGSFVGDFKERDVRNHEVKRKRLCLPRLEEGGLDLSRILQTIGAFFETGKFFQKYQVMAFPRCVAVANRLASLELYEGILLNDVPVLNSITSRPKDLCIFLASWIDLKRGLFGGNGRSILEFENMCKIVGSLGKITLIGCGRSYSSDLWFKWVDAITQNTALVDFVWKQNKRRWMASGGV